MKNALRFLPLALLALFALASGCSESSDGESESCSDFEAEALGDASVCENSFVKTSCLGDGAAESYPNLAKACGDAAKDKDGDGDNEDPGDNEDEDPAPTTCTGDEIRNVSCGLNSRGFQKQVCVDGIFINHPLEPCGDPDVCVNGTKENKSCEDDGETGIKTRTCEDGQWSDFGACHICNEGEIDILGCESHLANPYRVCNSKNSYDECKIDDYDDIDNKIFYNENGASHGNTFTTDVNGISSISISIWLKQTDTNTNGPGTVVNIRIHNTENSTDPVRKITLDDGSVTIYGSDSHIGYDQFNFPMWVQCETKPYRLHDCGSVPRTSVFNLLTITISSDEFKFYYNGEYIEDIDGKTSNSPVFQFPGLEENETFEIYQTHNGATYSHTTIIDGILSPEDVKLLYEKGPASP